MNSTQGIVRVVRKLTLTSLFLAIAWCAQAQVNYKVHSLFVYKFTQYIEWPDAGSSAPFVIGVVGNSPITAELEALAPSKKVGARSITIKKLSASSPELTSCQIVFVAESQSSALAAVSAKLAGKSVLLLSETSGGAKKGAGINFIIVEDKMKFELNKSVLEKQGLRVSSDLIKLAIVVG